LPPPKQFVDFNGERVKTPHIPDRDLDRVARRDVTT
jgi:hypothetical protein